MYMCAYMYSTLQYLSGLRSLLSALKKAVLFIYFYRVVCTVYSIYPSIHPSLLPSFLPLLALHCSSSKQASKQAAVCNVTKRNETKSRRASIDAPASASASASALFPVSCFLFPVWPRFRASVPVGFDSIRFDSTRLDSTVLFISIVVVQNSNTNTNTNTNTAQHSTAQHRTFNG